MYVFVCAFISLSVSFCVYASSWVYLCLDAEAWVCICSYICLSVCFCVHVPSCVYLCLWVGAWVCIYTFRLTESNQSIFTMFSASFSFTRYMGCKCCEVCLDKCMTNMLNNRFCIWTVWISFTLT